MESKRSSSFVLMGTDEIYIINRYYRPKEIQMKLNAPKTITWWVAVIVGALGIIGKFVTIAFISANAFWFVVVAFVLLALATFLKGL